jgi:sigma-E factor negative regulatory protein RseC
MLMEMGRIVAIEQDHLWVETINQSACGTCAAEKGCGQSLLANSLLAKWAARNAYLKVSIDGRNPASFNVNDAIRIGLPEGVVVSSSLLMYCLPILLLLAGGAAGEYGAGSETASVFGALLGLLGGGGLVKLYSIRFVRNRRLQPIILEGSGRGPSN